MVSATRGASVTRWTHHEVRLVEFMKLVQDAFGLSTTVVESSADQSSALWLRECKVERRWIMLAILPSDNINA